MNFNALFEISDPLGTRAFRGKWAASMDDAFAFSRRERVPEAPVPVSWSMGTGTPSDIIWTGMVAPVILHERVLEVFAEAQVTGWCTYDVEVRDKKGQKVEGYYGLAVTGRCGARDLEKSEIILQEYPGGWAPEFKGHFFDPESWDGSDLFMETPDPAEPASSFRFATEKFVKVLKRAKVSNLRFTPLPEVITPILDYEIGSPHRLPKNLASRVRAAYAEQNVPMPDDVAEQLTTWATNRRP